MKTKAHWMLVVLTIIWGFSFIALSDGVKVLAPETLLFWRFLVASVALLGANVFNKKACLPWKEGFIASIMFAIAYYAQTKGLLYTSPSVAAFITGLLVIFTPIFEAVVAKKAPPLRVWLSSLIALLGTYFLVGTGNGNSTSLGVFLQLICAILFSVHIVYLGSKSHLDPIAFVAVQCIFMSAFYGGLATVKGTFAWPGQALLGILYLGLLATALGLSLQVKAQRSVSPSEASLIFSLEPVFAAIFSAIILKEKLTWSSFLGMGLIFIASLAVDFNWQKDKTISSTESGR